MLPDLKAPPRGRFPCLGVGLWPSGPWRTLYDLNPMVGVVEGFRWALLGSSPPGPMIAVSALVSVALLVSGAYYFRQMEDTFAHVV